MMNRRKQILTIAFLVLLPTAATGQDVGAAPNTPAANVTLAAWPEGDSLLVERLPPVTAEAPPTPLPPPESKVTKGGMSGMPFGDRGAPLGYRASWFPTVPVSGQNANFSIVDQSLSVAAPLGMPRPDGDSPLGRPAGGWMLSASVKNKTITTEALLPDTGQPYPDELWNINVGLMYFRKLDNGWSFGGGAFLGSASDRPFASTDEMSVGMMAFLRIPSGERNAWMFSLMYSPMGELKFPIPGVAYAYSPSDDFRMNIGLPFSIMCRPVEHLTLEASYMPIHTIHAKAKYDFLDWLSAFAAYDWAFDAYSLADRVEFDQRFFMYDQRLAAGLESKIGDHGFLELAAGLAFDRYSFEGKQWDTTQFNRVSMGSGPFVTLQSGVRF